MSERPYRGFRKTYGGDPDRAIMNDLHKRLMKVEIAADRAETRLRAAEASIEEVHRRLHYLLVAGGGIVDPEDQGRLLRGV